MKPVAYQCCSGVLLAHLMNALILQLWVVTIAGWINTLSRRPMASLSEVARDDAPNREVLVEIRPMRTVG